MYSVCEDTQRTKNKDDDQENQALTEGADEVKYILWRRKLFKGLYNTRIMQNIAI